MYLHTGNGQLKPYANFKFQANLSDDTAAAFFDSDGDGDLDLLIGVGGNNAIEQRNYTAQLLLNDGKGNFVNATKTLPTVFKNIATISPEDFDNDGDIDVFIGSRSVPGVYGVNPNHLLLENKGDNLFTDATEKLGYDLKDLGMVTGAVWADIDGDDKKDLITVAEWGAPQIFKNRGRRISHLTSSLDSLTGWWNTVEAADLDGDGDQDLILGNDGLNLHYKPEPNAPLKLWVNDFDNNGTIEQIVTYTADGKDYPILQKKELTAQLVSLKKQNLKASDYAKRTIQELFPKEIIANSIVKETTTTSSVIAYNDGDGQFTIKLLPQRVQFSCICGITCTDLNNDGFLDIVMAGNNFEFKPQYSRLDAGYGNVLLGNKEGEFSWTDYNKSGFFIRDEVKSLKQFNDNKGNRFIIAAINDNKPEVYAIN